MASSLESSESIFESLTSPYETTVSSFESLENSFDLSASKQTQMVQPDEVKKTFNPRHVINVTHNLRYHINFPTQQTINDLSFNSSLCVIPKETTQKENILQTTAFTVQANNNNIKDETSKDETNKDETDSCEVNKHIELINSCDYIEITNYLIFTQADAAKKIGLPASTLSKRWREATFGRKWPQRTIKSIDRKIISILRNTNNSKKKMTEEQELYINVLLKEREKELLPVVIRSK